MILVNLVLGFAMLCVGTGESSFESKLKLRSFETWFIEFMEFKIVKGIRIQNIKR